MPLNFVDHLPGPRMREGSFLTPDILDELRANPGKWAEILVLGPEAKNRRGRAWAWNAKHRAEGFKFASRKNSDGGIVVYGAYMP